jgi:putative ABC transport system permease protein
LKVPALRGRDFDDRDTPNAPTVAIVNRAFVRSFLNGDADGAQRIALASDPTHYRQIVGVVGDVPQAGIEKRVLPEVFLPLSQVEDIWLAIVARTEGDPVQYITPIRNAIQSVDPGIAAFLPRTIEQLVLQQKGWRTFETSLVSSFAAIAILLASIGSYAVVSSSISQRMPEIGIRMALGATGKDVLTKFTLQGSLPAILGAAVGILAALGTSRFSASLLYGIGATDAFSYFAAALVILASAIGASYSSARRAASLNPSRALRYE